MEFMNSKEICLPSGKIREKFLEFFEKRGHKVVPSSSLIPTDPSVLLTTAGMQQFKPYYTNEKNALADFGSQNTASIQKCFRTSDIDEVGDESHLTFFEMLGNFSFGGYFKEEAIKYAKEFFESTGLKIEYVTVFAGDEKTPPDEESYKIWQSLGIKDIQKAGREDNFWGPTGKEGPCGPTTEIYVNSALRQAQGKPPVEVWNIVFNEYYCLPNGSFEKLPNPGVDTGMGLERLVMVMQGKNNIFETDLFSEVISLLPKDLHKARKRIVADHLRASVFLLADGVRPSNKERGYILRRLLRRALAYEYTQNVPLEVFESVLNEIIKKYRNFYSEFDQNKDEIVSEFKKEKEQFLKVLPKGLKQLEKLILEYPPDKFGRVRDNGELPIVNMPKIPGDAIFDLYQSYGLTPEIFKEELANRGLAYDEKQFELVKKKHQEISRAGAEKKFGGHGIVGGIVGAPTSVVGGRSSDKIAKLHTATHLLLAALRKTLGKEIEQKGSDINDERARFDFNFPRKLTVEEIQKVEELVNEKIREDLPVVCKEMTLEEAKQSGALGVFEHKYGEKVKVYSIGVPSTGSGPLFSREICGGPHVKNTGEIGHFKITKEESVSAGVRRVRAVID
ncbi:MAG: Alanine-tRNA ligase [Parcubacteria group bacterium GW2011_GWB1_41_6]|nr:MAG: Alanine-tRNA ligase [Parcubacteria group bacterium GW2011_GWB1_41_6]KKS34449.1 MAG: Alanine-tRNA ligase [Parcubacteria group bacterium GW2011_GWC2_42_13]